MNHLRTIALTFLAVLILSPLSAAACSCDATPFPAKALEQADLVFFGTVSRYFQGTGIHAESQLFWEFAVEGVWKGPAQQTMRIYENDFDGSEDKCGHKFEVGLNYLVYAFVNEKAPNRFRAHLCSRTKPGKESLLDLAYLGAPPHTFAK
ncbi:MAG: hypothetical protein ACI8W3_002575 [Myxococcota bacterium]|jgi:hypothetical protein